MRKGEDKKKKKLKRAEKQIKTSPKISLLYSKAK
jgi:hypothetical protein